MWSSSPCGVFLCVALSASASDVGLVPRPSRERHERKKKCDRRRSLAAGANMVEMPPCSFGPFLCYAASGESLPGVVPLVSLSLAKRTCKRQAGRGGEEMVRITAIKEARRRQERRLQEKDKKRRNTRRGEKQEIRGIESVSASLFRICSLSLSLSPAILLFLF